ncbi:MAG: hypothetical protein FJ317_07805, partial [SAR202 cluster bacterium]|nr:hypothetical protein [SAR202 cluster bacterium]
GKVIVVIPDATHLGNDLESFARSLLEIESMGLKVYSADHDYPDPIQSALHSIGVRGVSRTRSERIKTSMRARALRGQGLGRPLYGYEISDDGSMKVVKQEAAVVELVFKLYVQDKLGFRLIAQHLNERNIRTRRGGDWNVVSIRDMIRNPGYMGTYSRFGLMVPRGYPAIVPALTFRAAQDLMSERRPFGRVSNPEPFLLSGMAYCGTCGNKMMGVTRRQTWKKKDGRRNHGVYRYYQCQSRQNQSRCGYHTWRAPRLEAAVLSQLRLALQAKEGQAAGDAGASDNGRGAALKEARGKRVVNAERRFVDAMKRAAKAEIGIAIVGEYLGELDKARRAVQGTGGGQNPAQRLNQWDSLNLTQRRDLLAENISRIVVHDETVEVVV